MWEESLVRSLAKIQEGFDAVERRESPEPSLTPSEALEIFLIPE